jgi:hypothetical protein
MMDTITLTAIILMTAGIIIFLYKYTISKQRLPYDSKINSELIITGFIYNALIAIAFLVIESFALKGDAISNLQSRQLLTDILHSVIFFGGIFFIMRQRVLKPMHYINTYDIVIYSLCIGIGIAVSNILFVVFIWDGLNMIRLSVSAVLVPISYMMIFAFFLIKVIEGEKKSLCWTFLLPIVILFADDLLCRNDSWVGIISHIILYLVLCGICMSLFFNSVRKNVQFEGIDTYEQMEHFENNNTFRETISYWFDNFMSHGKIALAGLLLTIGLIVVVLVTAVILTETPEITDGEIGRTMWLSFMRVLDPGNVATDPEYNNPKFVLITTIATFVGLALVATYIGMVSGGFGSRIERLREGNSRILEKEHILFIGFCEDTLSIIDNLMKFNKGKESLKIGIVSGLSRKEMEERISAYHLIETHHRIICRSGDLESRTTLMNMSITTASCIVIIGDEHDDNLRIAMMVSDILSAERFNDIDILLQIDRTNEDLQIARNTFGRRMKIFSNREIDFDPLLRGFMLKEYLRLYGNLIGVDGDLVVSLAQEKECIGKTFGEIINGFIYSDVIGLVIENRIILNPDKTIVIKESHKLILLAPADTEPDYISPAKAFLPQKAEKLENFEFIRESVKTVLLIGNDSEGILTTLMENHYPDVMLLKLIPSNIKSVLKEIDIAMNKQIPDVVVFMNLDSEDPEKDDDLCLKLAAYLDSKFNRKENNYVTAAYMHSSQNTKFVYELDYIDMVFNNDNSRKIALKISDSTNMILQVEQKLLEAGDRIGAVLAEQITGTDEKRLFEVYRDCVEQDLILVGYIIREGGFLNVVLNPNKNGKIRFDNDDLLLVLK